MNNLFCFAFFFPTNVFKICFVFSSTFSSYSTHQICVSNWSSGSTSGFRPGWIFMISILQNTMFTDEKMIWKIYYIILSSVNIVFLHDWNPENSILKRSIVRRTCGRLQYTVLSILYNCIKEKVLSNKNSTPEIWQYKLYCITLKLIFDFVLSLSFGRIGGGWKFISNSSKIALEFSFLQTLPFSFLSETLRFPRWFESESNSRNSFIKSKFTN